ncbi:hypothetical protein AAC387_Pa09g2062 [Persea americana]
MPTPWPPTTTPIRGRLRRSQTARTDPPPSSIYTLAPTKAFLESCLFASSSVVSRFSPRKNNEGHIQTG